MKIFTIESTRAILIGITAKIVDFDRWQAKRQRNDCYCKANWENLTDLKNFYGGRKRMIESLKYSGAGADEVYVSFWKFYESLDFLNDAFTPWKTK